MSLFRKRSSPDVSSPSSREPSSSTPPGSVSSSSGRRPSFPSLPSSSSPSPAPGDSPARQRKTSFKEVFAGLRRSGSSKALEGDSTDASAGRSPQDQGHQRQRSFSVTNRARTYSQRGPSETSEDQIIATDLPSDTTGSDLSKNVPTPFEPSPAPALLSSPARPAPVVSTSSIGSQPPFAHMPASPSSLPRRQTPSSLAPSPGLPASASTFHATLPLSPTLEASSQFSSLSSLEPPSIQPSASMALLQSIASTAPKVRVRPRTSFEGDPRTPDGLGRSSSATLRKRRDSSLSVDSKGSEAPSPNGKHAFATPEPQAGGAASSATPNELSSAQARGLQEEIDLWLNKPATLDDRISDVHTPDGAYQTVAANASLATELPTALVLSGAEDGIGQVASKEGGVSDQQGRAASRTDEASSSRSSGSSGGLEETSGIPQIPRRESASAREASDVASASDTLVHSDDPSMPTPLDVAFTGPFASSSKSSEVLSPSSTSDLRPVLGRSTPASPSTYSSKPAYTLTLPNLLHPLNPFVPRFVLPSSLSDLLAQKSFLLSTNGFVPAGVVELLGDGIGLAVTTSKWVFGWWAIVPYRAGRWALARGQRRP